MPSKISTVLTVTAVLAVAQVTAMPTYPAKIPNGSNVKGVDALGHVDPSGGGARNAFGTAFGKAGHSWTKELCEADSDGDGQTNGQELGDPCCQWVEKSNVKVQWTTGVSHPGDATSKSDPSLWASVTCGASSDAATSNSTSASTGTTTAPSTSTTTTTTTAPSASTTAPRTTAPTPTPSSAATTTSFAVASAAAATALAAFFA